jgi:polar amino acid transport system substrate-binding protein
MAIECLKSDGTLSSIYQEWFGVKPDADSSTVKIYPGIGAPGFEGYDPTEHKLACKS